MLGPVGPLELTDAADQGRVVSPPVRGFYRVMEGGREELRTAILDPDEITAEPRPPVAEKMAATVRGDQRGVDVSNEFGWALVGLLAIELALRVARMVRSGGFRAAPAP